MNREKAIVLVEDDTDDVEFLQDALSKTTSRPIIRFANGSVFADYLSYGDSLNQTAIVVLDLNMPLKDGFTVLSELRQKNEHIPVVVLTASARDSDQAKCYNLGCNMYFTKPYSLPEYGAIAESIARLAEKA